LEGRKRGEKKLPDLGCCKASLKKRTGGESSWVTFFISIEGGGGGDFHIHQKIGGENIRGFGARVADKGRERGKFPLLQGGGKERAACRGDLAYLLRFCRDQRKKKKKKGKGSSLFMARRLGTEEKSIASSLTPAAACPPPWGKKKKSSTILHQLKETPKKRNESWRFEGNVIPTPARVARFGEREGRGGEGHRPFFMPGPGKGIRKKFIVSHLVGEGGGRGGESSFPFRKEKGVQAVGKVKNVSFGEPEKGAPYSTATRGGSAFLVSDDQSEGRREKGGDYLLQ